jgi:hypothetical protein
MERMMFLEAIVCQIIDSLKNDVSAWKMLYSGIT